jgi:hypothetical protein
MEITASSWLKSLVDKKVIISNHFEDYQTLFWEMEACEQIVPGFERHAKKCKDFISDDMRRTYHEMVEYRRRK